MNIFLLLSLLFISGSLAADCPWRTHLFITTPPEMEALSGSCLIIPCKFSSTVPEIPNKRLFGAWRVNEDKFDSFPWKTVFSNWPIWPVNIYPMTITGNLNQKTCTTLFSNLTTSYTKYYFFRIENTKYKATAGCDPVYIKIKDSPWRPSITISGELQEKESVTITCSALTPCPHSPPELTWNLHQNASHETEENTDGTFTTKIQETITLSDTHDGNKINCSVRYPVNAGKNSKTAETEKTLSVSYAPKETSASISPSGWVSAGSWVNLSCSSRAKPPVSLFTWFKRSTDGDLEVSEGDVYSFNVTQGGVYYCIATNHLGNQTSADIALQIEASSLPVRRSLTSSFQSAPRCTGGFLGGGLSRPSSLLAAAPSPAGGCLPGFHP
ncbi:sialoadhesin-like isoform 1-T1 [Pholidichthys leucotaenia]